MMPAHSQYLRTNKQASPAGIISTENRKNKWRLRSTKRDTRLYNLYELVHPAVTGEYGLSEQQLGQYAARWPDVDVCRVVCGTENELRGAVVPRADIRHVGFAADQLLGAEETQETKSNEVVAKDGLLVRG